MNIKIILLTCFIISCPSAQCQVGGQISANVAEGVGVSAVTDWLMEESFSGQKGTPDYRAKKGTLEVIMKSITDQVFRDQLVGQLFATNDPRRYLLTALFQSGKFAHKGLEFIQQFALKLPAWFAQKESKTQYMSLFPQEDISKWFSALGPDQCPTQQSWQDKALDQFAALQDTAFSCVVGHVINVVASQIVSRATGQNQAGGLLAFAVTLLPKVTASIGTPYFVDWSRGILNDIWMVESSPVFEGQALKNYL